MKKRKIIKDNVYDGYPVMADTDKRQYLDGNILNELKRQFDYADESKNKNFFMRFDMRYPENMPSHGDNTPVVKCLASTMKSMNRQGLRPQYLLVREQSQEKHQHYHGILMLDGNKTQNTHNHIQTLERLWNKALDIPYEVQPGNKIPGHGLINDCTKDRSGNIQVNGVMLRRDDPEYEVKKQDCFRRASYLAKLNQKGSNPSRQRELFSSRIPKDKD